MLVEHDYPLIARGAGARNRQRAREFAQIEGVLNGVELEVLMRQRAVGQPIDKRMAKDRCVDGPDRFPEFRGEFHVWCSLRSLCARRRLLCSLRLWLRQCPPRLVIAILSGSLLLSVNPYCLAPLGCARRRLLSSASLRSA